MTAYIVRTRLLLFASSQRQVWGVELVMAELRELLGAWRDAKASASKAVIDWVVRSCLALVLIGLAVKLGLSGLVSQ